MYVHTCVPVLVLVLLQWHQGNLSAFISSRLRLFKDSLSGLCAVANDTLSPTAVPASVSISEQMKSGGLLCFPQTTEQNMRHRMYLSEGPGSCEF